MAGLLHHICFIRRIPVPILHTGSDKREDAVPVFCVSLFQEPVC